MSFSHNNNNYINSTDFWNLLVTLGYIPQKFLNLRAVGACHGMSILAIVHFQDGTKGLDKLNHRLHILNQYANLDDNFTQFKLDLENAKFKQAQKISTKETDELIEIDILLQNCAIAHCLYFYDQLLEEPVVELLYQSTKTQNPLTAFSLVNSITGEKQGLIKPLGGNFLNSYNKNQLAEVITLLKSELKNFSFKHPVNFIVSTRRHDVCFSYFPKDKQWAYFGIREKAAMIVQDDELITHVWNNMNSGNYADIGMEIYLAKTDAKTFQKCLQQLTTRKNWKTLQTISNSSAELAVTGSKFSDVDNVEHAVSRHSFFHNNKSTVCIFAIFSLLVATTKIDNLIKIGSIIFAVIWANMNFEYDTKLNRRVRESSLLKEVEEYVQPDSKRRLG